MKTPTLKARVRTEKGTRACKKLRARGEVPANLYMAVKSPEGTRLETTDLAVPAYDLIQLIEHQFTVVQVAFGGAAKTALIKEVQRDVFGDDLLHVDLEAIDATKRVKTSVRLVIKGTAKGTQEGGRLQVELHELEIEVLPTEMPSQIEARVDALGLEQALLVKDLKVPAGVKVLTSAEATVARVVAARTEEEPEAGAAPGPSEPELIGRKKEEEEEKAE